MTEQEYEDILDQNVDEVKTSLDELEDPDYEELLELERDGENRKTVIEYLEDKADTQQDEEIDDVVQEIEEETAGGLLAGFTAGQVLAGGAVLGLLIGLIAGFGLTDLMESPPADVESNVMELLEADFDGEAEIVDVSSQHGMSYVTAELEFEAENETQTEQESFYVSPDGEVLFLEVIETPMGPVQGAINIQETLEQIEMMEDMPEEEMMPEEGMEMEEEPAPEGEQEIEIDPEDLEGGDIELE